MARALHTVIAASFGEITSELREEQDNPRDAVPACASRAATAATRTWLETSTSGTWCGGRSRSRSPSAICAGS
ncbi:hypothetical protein V1227_14725 [Lentzea sp. DG1S-22]|uniref:hypothetical protein n=1 Tax=Lentzea sp. DG1S-22 TaxID=3108822 RepID=UPI002E78FE27|nr:hypothetical protein [Lentzea sp. DG1S-22]WVH83947.1 hypothetical protein V1227_14725 [Lentzea sp. DG1S-22]